jgi:hypothetical protein
MARPQQGCQIFLGATHQNGKKTKCPQNVLNGLKIDQTAIFNCNTLQNLSKLRFFGLKIYHLATLDRGAQQSWQQQ